ncbi:hypothetical protein D9M72_514270 [compost metagenome]
MILLRDRIGELDRETIPDPLVVGHAQRRLLPDLGSLATTVEGIRTGRNDAQLECAFAGVRHLVLKFHRARTLLEVIAIVEPAFGCEVLPLKAV